jgi:hypothetical protein
MESALAPIAILKLKIADRDPMEYCVRSHEILRELGNYTCSHEFRGHTKFHWHIYRVGTQAALARTAIVHTPLTTPVVTLVVTPLVHPDP